MKATIYCVASPGDDGPALDLALRTTLPFIPHPGMALKFHEHGDHHPVAEVLWDCSKPNEIDVFIVEPDSDALLPKAEQLLAQGWEEQ